MNLLLISFLLLSPFSQSGRGENMLFPPVLIQREPNNFSEDKTFLNKVKRYGAKEKYRKGDQGEETCTKGVYFTRNHGICVDTYDQTYPSMAVNSKGTIYAAVDYYNGSTYEVDVFVSRDNGDNWDYAFYLYSSTYNYRHPHIVINQGDTIYIFYETDDTLGFQYLESPDGEKWYRSYISSWTFYPDRCLYPRAAVKDSFIYVAFMYDYYGDGSDYDVGYLYSKDHGNSWYDYHDGLANTANHELYPVVAISDSVVGIAYMYETASADSDWYDIMYDYDKFADSWTEIYGIASYHDDYYPDLYADGNYMVIACMRNYNYPASDWDIWMRRSSNGGTSWDGFSFRPAHSGYDEKYPSIFCIADTMYLVYTFDSRRICYADSFLGVDTWAADTCSEKDKVYPAFRNSEIIVNSTQKMVSWVDTRNEGNITNIGKDIYFATDYPITKSCDIKCYKPQDWTDFLIPSNVKGTTTPSNILPGSPPTGGDSTYIDFALIDASPVDDEDTIYSCLYVDDAEKQFFYSPPLPTGWYAYALDYSILIMGGRHTLKVVHDYTDRNTELDEANNLYGKQWVFSPLYLSDDSPGIYKAPPYPQTEFSPPDTFNCDGFSVTPTNYWGCVGIRPPEASDYDMRIYTDYSNSTSGFSNYITTSSADQGGVDFIMINGNYLSDSTFYPGVYRHSGVGDYLIEWDRTDGTLGSSGWNPYDTLYSGHVLNVYDVYLSSGQIYYVALEQTGSNETLGFAVYSSWDGKYIKAKGDWECFRDTITGGITKDTSFTTSTSGWHGIVVWSSSNSSKGDGIYRIYISSSPLSIALSDFSISLKNGYPYIAWRSELKVDSWKITRKSGRDGERYELPPDARHFYDRRVQPGNYTYSLYYKKNGLETLLKSTNIHVPAPEFSVNLMNTVVTDHLLLRIGGHGKADVKIFGIDGRIFYRGRITESSSGFKKIRLDLPSGVYLIKVCSDKEILVNKKILLVE